MIAKNFRKYLLTLFILFTGVNTIIGQVVINEVYIRPDGVNSGVPNGIIYTGSKEYIELYNTGCTSVNVAGYFLACKQEFGSGSSGGSIVIPNVPNATIPPRGHLLIASNGPGAELVGNVDIKLSPSNVYCLYTNAFIIANSDGWLALFDPSGNPLDCVYWASNASKINSGTNSGDFDPSGTICVPSSATPPSIPLKTATQIFNTKPCVVSYIPITNPTLIYRTTDGASTWSFSSSATPPITINKSITGGNCNGGPGACITSNPVVSAPGIGVITPASSCGGTGSVVLNALPNSNPNNKPPCLNWTVTQSPGGTTTTENTASTTISGLAPGNYTFTVANSGGCNSVASVNVTITGPTNCCSVGPASSTPTLCVNTALTNITHTTTGATGIGTATGLPSGVTASWGSNTITISGTPTATGTFNYSIPVTGASCSNINATGTITVTPINTAAAGSSTPSLCVNTVLTNITHTTTGATGIGTATGLPAGVTASWASNTITISGTPTASGTFNYTIPLTGGCGNVNATGTITVTAANTTGTASSTPTLCVNTLLTNITHTTTGATGIGTATGFPAGVTASWASNTITISGTPTATGTFNYTIPLTGGCGNVNATGTITVTAANSVGAASSSPTLCINTLLTNITHATTVATGIGTATGLPAGVTASWASNTITISGTPTASGTFNYTIPLTGGCGNINATGTITITAANTVGPASSAPTPCVNTPLTNITHTTTGATGIGTATGFPAGVTASWASNTITISGTPTATGTFNYTIPLTGGCGTVSATGTITVGVLSTAGPASSSPTLCVNTPLTNITHTTTGATGIGAATGLPPGVTASWASNTITISGTPTAIGPFNYTIPLTGGCGNVNATGTITVTPTNTVATASSTPTLCINSPLTNITHATTGATGIDNANITGLPSGVSASFSGNATTGTITISGTPSSAGTFTYSIPLTGGCGNISANGSITVVGIPAQPTVTTNCPGGPGSGVITVTGPVGNFEYSLDGGAYQSSATFNNVANGPHTIRAREKTALCLSTTASVNLNCGCLNPPSVSFNAATGTSGNTCVSSAKTIGGTFSGSVSNVTVTHNGTGTLSAASFTTSPFSFDYTPGAGEGGSTVEITVTANTTDPLCSAAQEIYTLSVRSLPTASVTAGTDVCPNGSSNFTLTGTPGATVTYTLNGGGNQTAILTGGSANVPLNSITTTQTITLVSVNDGTCSDNLTATATVTVIPNETPTFNPVAPICINATAPVLPTTSNEGISGTWNPSVVSNTASGTYSFTATPITGRCFVTTPLTVSVNTTPPTPQFDPVPAVCINTLPAPVLPTTSKDGVTGTWNPATVSTTFSDTYTFTPDPGQCAANATLDVTVALNPVVELGEPRIDILEGESVTLSAIVSGTNSYVWTPTTDMTGSTTLTPVVNPTDDVTYTLTATTTDGCVAKDTVRIIVLNELIIPNIFSPNGDGINDRFEIENIEKYKDATMDIFNRYGQRLMRYVGGYNTPWDGKVNGKDAPVGTYFYVIIPNAGKRKVISGSISIVR